MNILQDKLLAMAGTESRTTILNALDALTSAMDQGENQMKTFIQ